MLRLVLTAAFLGGVAWSAPCADRVAAGSEKRAPVLIRRMVPQPDDYRIGVDDLVQVEVSDLSGPGASTCKRVVVNERGNIKFPFIGFVHAAGLTAYDLERELTAKMNELATLSRVQLSATVYTRVEMPWP